MNVSSAEVALQDPEKYVAAHIPAGVLDHLSSSVWVEVMASMATSDTQRLQRPCISAALFNSMEECGGWNRLSQSTY